MTELISSTKSHLKRVVPNAKDVLIKVERDHDLFLSKIHVHVPGKTFHAEKRAKTVWEAVDSSYQAVLKQVEKIKNKHREKRKLRKQRLRELNSTMPPP